MTNPSISNSRLNLVLKESPEEKLDLESQLEYLKASMSDYSDPGATFDCTLLKII